MSAEFTSGPWEAKTFYVHVEGKGTVCSVANPWDDEVERQANTYLIAAAPKLYEKVEIAAAIFEEYARLHLAKGTPDGNAKAKRNMEYALEMRAAAAKARGEQ